MKLKKELQDENLKLRTELALVKKIPCGYRITTCPSCHISLLLTDNQFNNRLRKDVAFYCSNGHSFIYTN